MMYVCLIIGFLLLIKGADLFVDGSSSIAKIFKVPTIIIGLTIVAMGTSAPELAVSVTASFQDNSEIALSNVVGSNIFNLLVVVGICSAFKCLVPAKDIVKRDLPVSILAAIITLVAPIITYLVTGSYQFTLISGIILLIGFITYIVVLLRNAKKNPVLDTPDDDIKVMSPKKSIIYMIIGLAGIIIGGNLVVHGASGIASSFGLSDTLIGLTIVAIGTSLPELATSIIATRKGENELSLGNAVGSNIFNILFILGISSVISPLSVETVSLMDSAILIIFSVIVLGYILIRKKIDRIFGVAMVLMYGGYMTYIILR